MVWGEGGCCEQYRSHWGPLGPWGRSCETPSLLSGSPWRSKSLRGRAGGVDPSGQSPQGAADGCISWTPDLGGSLAVCVDLSDGSCACLPGIRTQDSDHRI